MRRVACGRFRGDLGQDDDWSVSHHLDQGLVAAFHGAAVQDVLPGSLREDDAFLAPPTQLLEPSGQAPDDDDNVWNLIEQPGVGEGEGCGHWNRPVAGARTDEGVGT